jgi:hypothetical protein
MGLTSYKFTCLSPDLSSREPPNSATWVIFVSPQWFGKVEAKSSPPILNLPLVLNASTVHKGTPFSYLFIFALLHFFFGVSFYTIGVYNPDFA